MVVNPDINPKVYQVLKSVNDPEIPVLSIVDMGVLRDVIQEKSGVYKIIITPTYSGCPAMDTIADDIVIAMEESGWKAKVDLVLEPAWTTDWITKDGRAALEKYGIAAPLNPTLNKEALLGKANMVKCTRCGSMDTKMISRFGSTACKSLFQCNDCHEPFDYFKCLK